MEKEMVIRLESPKESWLESGALFLWRTEGSQTIKTYTLYLNGNAAGETIYEDFSAEGLCCETEYEAYVEGLTEEGIVRSNTVKILTKPEAVQLDITEYGAVGDGVTVNTAAIQQAVDACLPVRMIVLPLNPAGMRREGKWEFRLNISESSIVRSEVGSVWLWEVRCPAAYGMSW